MRRSLLAWEFWVPPLLAIVTIGAMLWLFNHNQDLLRQKQIDDATKVQVEQVASKIQALVSEIGTLREQVKSNARDVKSIVKTKDDR